MLHEKHSFPSLDKRETREKSAVKMELCNTFFGMRAMKFWFFEGRGAMGKSCCMSRSIRNITVFGVKTFSQKNPQSFQHLRNFPNPVKIATEIDYPKNFIFMFSHADGGKKRKTSFLRNQKINRKKRRAICSVKCAGSRRLRYVRSMEFNKLFLWTGADKASLNGNTKKNWSSFGM